MSVNRTFWLQLHAIAGEILEEGDSDYERALMLTDLLTKQSADERTAYLADLETVSSALYELLSEVVKRRWQLNLPLPLTPHS